MRDRPSSRKSKPARFVKRDNDRRRDFAPAREFQRAPMLNNQPDLIWGFNPIVEAFQAKRRRIHEVLFSGGDRDQEGFLERLKSANVNLRHVPRSELDRLSHDAVHQGLVARVAPYPFVELSELFGDGANLILALDGVTDPQNVGAICRSARAFGVTGVILPKDNASGITGAVCKSSAGAVESLKIAHVVNLTRALEDCKKHGFWIYGAGLSGQVIDLRKVDPGQQAVIVLGSEGKGLRRLVSETCDQLVTVVMPGGFESLNVAQAGTLFLYEFSNKMKMHQTDN